MSTLSKIGGEKAICSGIARFEDCEDADPKMWTMFFRVALLRPTVIADAIVGCIFQRGNDRNRVSLNSGRSKAADESVLKGIWRATSVGITAPSWFTLRVMYMSLMAGFRYWVA